MRLFIKERAKVPLRLFLFVLGKDVSYFKSFISSAKLQNAFFLKGFSTIGTREENLCAKGPSRSVLLRELQTSLREHQVKEAWKTYKDFKNIFGYPDQCFVNDLITESSYSADTKSLQWACNLVLSISREKTVSLKPDAMIKLALSLARAHVPVSASSVLRVTLEKRCLPSLSVLQMIFMHMVKTKIGVYLASNILVDIFQKLEANKSSEIVLTKPDTIIFNLVLDACVSFRAPLRGYQIVELMAQAGVIADVHTAAVVSRIYEMIGLREELKKFDVLLDTFPRTWDILSQQFYDSLLSLHFKFNDIDGLATLLINLCGDLDLKHCQSFDRKQLKSSTVSIGSDNSKIALNLQFVPQKLRGDFVPRVESKKEFILRKDGNVVLTKRGITKLIVMYKKSGRINELSKLLVSIKNMLSSSNSSPCSDLIDVFIHLGWLETAHDIIDDLEIENCIVSEISYAHLLAAYHNKGMLREAEALERQIKKANYDINSSTLNEVLRSAKEKILRGDLVKSIIENMKEEEHTVNPSLHEFNSSIYFFSKARMMEDAKDIYRKMQKLDIHPNSTTYFHLICGYSSLEAYRENTFLWGDIKRSIQKGNNTLHDRDLYELLLMNFIRGGYFERVMEIIGLMSDSKMFIDKEMYKAEFLKLHRSLYWRLNPSDAKDETQKKRILLVQAFRKFSGIG